MSDPSGTGLGTKGEFMGYSRFAVYYIAPEGPLASFGARWLGWDVITGTPADPLDVAGRAEATETPRKYGFHGTLKPPFRLAEGLDLAALQTAMATLAARQGSARCDGLQLSRLGRFLALTPVGETGALAALAEACVTELDLFRAPPSAEELARRRGAGLSPAQEANLVEWGYPYVRDQFRFHMTLTGRLPKPDLPSWEDTLRAALPPLPAPFVIDSLGLVGERADGRFELIQRYALTG
ncbi:DUF1045 domain-containing protein [Dinoroseobacter sp. S124A]|uniref:DUF1045 domain-containing protein n=1 Tax=Dinoroseobacter sp. S124A TaxID=3415128 RepID=UPI003C79A9CC